MATKKEAAQSCMGRRRRSYCSNRKDRMTVSVHREQEHDQRQGSLVMAVVVDPDGGLLHILAADNFVAAAAAAAVAVVGNHNDYW